MQKLRLEQNKRGIKSMTQLPPEEKGWKLVKDILNNDEQYLALKQGFYITLTGSNKIQYVIYPNGKVVKLTDTKPVLGKLQIKSDYVKADYLATLIAWIKYNADKFEEQWKCGTLTLNDETTQEREARLIRRQEQLEVYRTRRHRSFNPDYIAIIPIIILTVIAVIMVGSINSSLNNYEGLTTDEFVEDVEAEPVEEQLPSQKEILLQLVPFIVGCGFIVSILAMFIAVGRNEI
jgi:hypothetical protein